MTLRNIVAAMATLTLGTVTVAQDDAERGPEPGSEAVGADASGFLAQDGETLYMTACAGCHQPQGQGAIGAGQYPPLAANPRLEGGRYPAWIVLNGVSGMPALGGYMDDAQVAAVVGYIQQNFGNRFEPNLTADDIAALRNAAAP